jgi:hypothetical protein
MFSPNIGIGEADTRMMAYFREIDSGLLAKQYQAKRTIADSVGPKQPTPLQEACAAYLAKRKAG